MKLILVMIFGLFSICQASQHYWKYGTGVGSSHFWNYGTDAGSKHFFKYGTTAGSHHFLKYGTESSGFIELLGVCVSQTEDLPFCDIYPTH